MFEGCDGNVATFMLTRGLQAMLLIASIVQKAKSIVRKGQEMQPKYFKFTPEYIKYLLIPSIVNVFAGVLAQ